MKWRSTWVSGDGYELAREDGGITAAVLTASPILPERMVALLEAAEGLPTAVAVERLRGDESDGDDDGNDNGL